MKLVFVVIVLLWEMDLFFNKHFHLVTHQQIDVQMVEVMQDEYFHHVCKKTKFPAAIILRIAENLKLEINDMDMR